MKRGFHGWNRGFMWMWNLESTRGTQIRTGHETWDSDVHSRFHNGMEPGYHRWTIGFTYFWILGFDDGIRFRKGTAGSSAAWTYTPVPRRVEMPQWSSTVHGMATVAGGGKCVKWRGNRKSFILKIGTKKIVEKRGISSSYCWKNDGPPGPSVALQDGDELRLLERNPIRVGWSNKTTKTKDDSI